MDSIYCFVPAARFVFFFFFFFFFPGGRPVFTLSTAATT